MRTNVKVEAEGNELVLRNSAGDYAIIPKDKRKDVQEMLDNGCNDCIDRLVDSLPVMDDYAEDGTVVPYTESYVKNLIERVNSSVPNDYVRKRPEFIQRLMDENRQSINDWEKEGAIATHKMAYGEADGKTYVYPNVQNIDGKLYDFTDPKNKRGQFDALNSALDRGDVIEMSPSDAKLFTENYKSYYHGFSY